MKFKTRIGLFASVPAVVVIILCSAIFPLVGRRYEMDWIMITLIIVLIVAVTIVSTLMVAERLMKPLDIFSKVLKKVNSDGDSLEIIHPQNANELKELYDGLSTLVTRIKDSVLDQKMISGEVKLFYDNVAEQMAGKNKELKVSYRTLESINRRMVEEMQTARRVQQGILPSDRFFNQRNEFNVSFSYRAMDSLGGDLYDIVRTGRNGYGFLIADVSGHGLSAALITMMVKAAFNANSGWNINPAVVCGKVNKELCKLMSDLEHFVTAFYANLNLETGVIQYTNAGHHPVYLYRPESGQMYELVTKGSILGAFEESEYHFSSMELKKGDCLLFYTDGIVEARNRNGIYYDNERLRQFLTENYQLKPKEFVDSLMSEIDEFTGGRPQEDDMSLLYVKYHCRYERDVSFAEAARIDGHLNQ